MVPLVVSISTYMGEITMEIPAPAVTVITASLACVAMSIAVIYIMMGLIKMMLVSEAEEHNVHSPRLQQA